MKINFKTISMAASTAVLGAVLLTGCGSSSSSSSSSSGTSGSAWDSGDGYLGGLGRVIHNGKEFKNVNFQGNAKGKFSINATKTKGQKITINPKGLYFDIDQSGDYNSSVDENLTFALKADASAGFISHLTTVAEDTNNTALADLVADFDPVAAAADLTSDDPTTKNKASSLLVLGEAVKTTLKSDSSSLANFTVNASDYNGSTTSDDVNVTAIMAAVTNPTLVTAVEAKVEAIKAVIEVIEDMNATGVDSQAIEELFTRVSDGGESVANAINEVDDINASDVNGTLVNNADAHIEAAEEEFNKLPAKLVVPNTLTVGASDFSVINGAFTGSITSTDGNISAFCDVSLGNVIATKEIINEDANLTISIVSQTTGDEVTLSILGAKVNAAEDGIVSVTIPTGTTIKATQTGLPALQSVMGTEATGITTSELTTTDFSFNVSTLLETLDSSSIQDAIGALSTYLKQSDTYDVTIDLDTAVYADYKTITGEVMVNMTDEAIKAANQATVENVETSLISMFTSPHDTVTDYIELPTTMDGATITWSTSCTKIDVATGSVTQTVGEPVYTTIIATITKGEGATLATDTKDISITIAAGDAPFEYDSTLTIDAVEGQGQITTNSDVSPYTLKVKTDASTPATGQALLLYVQINNIDYSVAVNNNYQVGTKFQIGIFEGSSLEALSDVYELSQADIDALETDYISVTMKP